MTRRDCVPEDLLTQDVDFRRHDKSLSIFGAASSLRSIVEKRFMRDIAALTKIAHHEALARDCEIGDTPTWQELDQALKNLDLHLAGALQRLERQESAEQKAAERYERRFQRLSEGFVADSIEGSFDPDGFFVYQLIAANGEVLYVGQSGNILSRLGSHMTDRKKRRRTKRVALIRCPSIDQMLELEARLISQLQPVWNVRGIRQ